MLKYDMGYERAIVLSDDRNGLWQMLSFLIYLPTAVLLVCAAENHILSCLKYPVYKELLGITSITYL